MSVEVTARFADTLLLVTRVAPGAEFRIGTAPDVDLPLPGLGSFPLVDRTGQILVPAGASATYACDGARVPVHRSARLAPGARVELVLGAVTIAIAEAPACARIAPPRGDRRALPYMAAMFAAHVALWACAVALADPPPPRALDAVLRKVKLFEAPRTPMPPPPRPHVVRGLPKPHDHAGVAQPMPAPTTDPAPAPTAVATRAGVRADVGDHAPVSLGDAMKALWGPDLPQALANLDPLYDETGAALQQFGGAQRRFDPTNRPEFASVPSGKYETVGHGPGAGEDYDLQSDDAESDVNPADVEAHLCEGSACRATGELDAHAVTTWISPYTDALRACGAGSVTLAFTIDGAGAVRNVHARARGKIGGCVAGVVAGIAFPRTDRATRVTYPIVLRRAG
jgi:hypothetical protein